MLDTEPVNIRNGGPLLLDTKEAQKLVPVSRTTLWQLASDGKIKTVHIGRRRFFTYESLSEFVRELSR
jgi:excisionase family DNA binding protein